jgi:energy-coupling factor transporter ATP-binding protein EcfA2
MILQKVDYCEFPKTISHWSLRDLTLGRINLLVGKNASGKSRTIDVIDNIGTILLKGIPSFYPHTAYSHVEFFDKLDLFQYDLELSDFHIINERLLVNNKTMIERGTEGIGKIYASKEEKMIDFQIPDKKSVLFSRQDAIQYPYLQKIFDWAEKLRLYSFGEYLGKDKGISIYSDDAIVLPTLTAEYVVWYFKQATKQFGDSFEKQILENMKMLGYDLTKLWINPYRSPYTGRILQTLCAMEDGREGLLFQAQMSQGMFRALSLLIQITYNVMNNTLSTILIDDIGEGLDFDRSSKLIKLLIKMTEENDNIQLIMSTNDRFVMNNVPLEYWQLIQRSGGECKVFNYQNSKEKFDEFEYMGLNNFDFLATDYLNSEWQKI